VFQDLVKPQGNKLVHSFEDGFLTHHKNAFGLQLAVVQAHWWNAQFVCILAKILVDFIKDCII